MEYFVKFGAGTTGKGTEVDPWEIDTTADLDAILDGSYDSDETDPPIGGLSSGDILIFEDGAYDDIRINNNATDGITFKAKNHRDIFGTPVVTIDWTSANEAPFGSPYSGGDSANTCTIEGIDFTLNANTMKHRMGAIQFNRCGFFGSGANFMQDKCAANFKFCLFELADGVTNFVKDLDTSPTFDFCTVIAQETDTGTAVYLVDNTTITFDNGVLARTASSNATYKQNGGAVNATSGKESHVYQWGSDFTASATDDPLFIDSDNDDYGPRDPSPLTQAGTA